MTSVFDPFSPFYGEVWSFLRSFPYFLWASSAKLSHSDQIVRYSGQGEVPIDFLDPSVSGLSEIADHLDPAKGLFDALANLDARLVAFVPRCSTVDG